MLNNILTWLRARAPEWATIAKDWLLRATAAIWASLAALLKSPAVWLACAVVFVGGFSLGHIERSVALRKVAAAKVEVEKTLAVEQAKGRALTVAVAMARQDAEDARKALADATPPPAPEKPPAAKETKPKRKQKPTAATGTVLNVFGL